MELRVVKLRVEADANFPSNKVRHVFGPYETFTIHQEPSGFFTFSPGSQGHATINGNVVKAPHLAERFTVTASSSYGSTTLMFNSIEPTEIVAIDCEASAGEVWTENGQSAPMPGEVAVGMVTRRRLLPDHVSFEHLYVEEGECPVSGVWGVFRGFKEALGDHDASAGAWRAGKVEVGNLIDDDFSGICFSAAFSDSISAGGFQYNVPNFWHVRNGSSLIGGRHYFCTTPGVFRLYDNGDFSINRFDCSVLRGTNGVSTVIRKP